MEYTIDEFSKFLYKNGVTNNERFLYDSIKENEDKQYKHNLNNSANNRNVNYSENDIPYDNNYEDKILEFLNIYLISKKDENLFDSVNLHEGYVKQDDELIIKLFERVINIRSRFEKNVKQKSLLKWKLNCIKLSMKAKYIAKLYYEDIKKDETKINEADLIEDEILEDKSLLGKYNNNLSVEMTDNLQFENTYENDYIEPKNGIQNTKIVSNLKQSNNSDKMNTLNMRQSKNSEKNSNSKSKSKTNSNINLNENNNFIDNYNINNNDNELESSNKNIYTKLYNDHKSKEKRMQNFIRKRNKEELIECTFKPIVNDYYWKKNKRSKSSLSGKTNRNKISNEFPIYIKLNNVSFNFK